VFDERSRFMKRRLMTAFAALSVMMTLGFISASAQTPDMLTINVPFQFTAGDRELPAGKYTIRPVSLKRLLIQSTDGGISTTVPVNYIQTRADLSKDKIIFNKYEERYFLTRIYQAGVERGYDVWSAGKKGQLAKSKKAGQPTTITGN
jgi:hypothetical protein